MKNIDFTRVAALARIDKTGHEPWMDIQAKKVQLDPIDSGRWGGGGDKKVPRPGDRNSLECRDAPLNQTTICKNIQENGRFHTR